MDCSRNFWKLDKFDKVVISLIFIVFTIFTIFSTFSFASENVELDEVKGVYVDRNSNYFIIGNEQYGTSYCKVESGYIYTVDCINGALGVQIAFGNDVPASNVLYYDRLSIGGDGSSYSFIVPNNFKYAYFYGSWSGFIRVTRERVGGMDNTVQYLADSISPDNLFNVFNISIPYILVVVVVSFGFYIIFKLIRRLSKGRSGNV